MVSIFLISLREYLEIFLIIDVFLGISKKLKINREKEIIFASLIGSLIAIILPIIVFIFADKAQLILTGKNAELLESYLMIFSGFFLAYVILSLHKFFTLNRSRKIIETHQKLQDNVFDVSLFLTLIFFVVREGFEIALFSATTSLFSRFAENLLGLILGLLISAIFGLLAFYGFLKFSINKIYKLTEVLIIFLGAAMVKNGISELLEIYFDVNLKNILPLKLSFLPPTNTFFGHLLKNNFGLQQDFSLAMAMIILFYFFVINLLFLKNKR
ncbi:MAG: FTR1 family protein [Microgenomates group bacterium]